MRKMMRRLATVCTALLAAFTFGCGVSVEVPPAHVGKLSTSSGLQKGIIPPSKLRLEGMCFTCDSLVVVEASDFPVKETMVVFIPQDKLNLTVEVRGTVSITSDDANVERIFSRVSAVETKEERVKLIPIETVYKVYGEPVVREAVRSLITQYNIMTVMQNRDRISQELTKLVQEKLSASPLTVLQFGLADVQPPPVIVAAQEAAKEREIAIDQAEANKQVSLKEAEAALAVAIKQQQVDLKEAETEVLVNMKLAEGVSPAFIAQRSLKVLNVLAQSENKVFFLPMEAMSNPAIIMGTMNDGFSQKRAVAKEKN